MSKDYLDAVGLTANFAAIVTAIIATIFYYRTQQKNYYLNDIIGNYKIYSFLKNQENATALHHIEIKYVSTKGWFYGLLQYTEPFKPPGSASGGSANVFGKINYSFWRLFLSFIIRTIRFQSFNPLEANDFGSFHGKLYLLSRNDLDISTRNWKDMLVQEYSLIHYKEAQRIKLFDPKKPNTYLQVPDKIVLVNVDKIPDFMFDEKIVSGN